MTTTTQPEQAAPELPAALPEDVAVLQSLWDMKVGDLAETAPLLSVSKEPIVLQCMEVFDKEKKASFRRFQATYYSIPIRTVTLTRSKGVFTWQ